MKAHEFYVLLYKRMSEKGYGSREITCNGDFRKITDIEYCTGCEQFHIISESPKNSLKVTYS